MFTLFLNTQGLTLFFLNHMAKRTTIISAIVLVSALSFTGCASQRIATDVLAQVNPLQTPLVNNASQINVSVNPKINENANMDTKMKESLEIALKNSNIFGSNTQQPYTINAEVLVASQARVSFGPFNGKLEVKYTVLNENGKQIFQDTIYTEAGSDLKPYMPGTLRHQRARARNIAININQFIEKLETQLKTQQKS